MNCSRPFILILMSATVLAAATTSCDDTKSYAELLTEETHNVNAFLANHRVVNSVPEDSVFETGKNAPYYRMDNTGNVYMQVLVKGDGERPKDEDQIYFRYMRYDLSNYAKADTLPAGSGNANDMDYEATWFRLNNVTLSASYKYGTGIQVPMNYLPLNSEVNIVIKSQYGFTGETSYVVPFLYHVRYFKPGV